MPPVNNDLANAVVLTGLTGGLGTFTIDDADTESGEPTPSVTGTIFQSIWFKWVAPSNVSVTFNTHGSIDTSDSSPLDTVLAVYTGTNFGDFVQVVADDDTPGLDFTSEVTFTAIAGTTYWIQASTYGGGVTGTMTGSFSSVIPPTYDGGDTCATAFALSGLSGIQLADNSIWAGPWPTGNDPLFNANGVGGGAPKWFKWANTTGVPVDFTVQPSTPPSDSIHYNLGIAIGSCGSLDMTVGDTDDGHLTHLGNTYLSNVNPAFTITFDLVVQPGETIYIEVDSYSGDTSEPPTAPRGKFKFTWGARAVTFYDGIPVSELLQSNVSSSVDTSNGIEPWGGLRVGNRYYFTWEVNVGTGYEFWAGDCDNDGSNLHTYRISDADATPAGLWMNAQVDKSTTTRTAKMATDGTNVWVVIPHNVTITNPDDAAYTDQFIGFIADHRDKTTTRQTQVKIFKYDSGTHTWPLWKDMVATAAHPENGPIWGHRNNYAQELGAGFFDIVPIASSSDVGSLWLHANYLVERDFVNNYHNNSAGGFFQAEMDNYSVYEYIDTWKLTDSSLTLANRLEQSWLAHYLVSYNPNVNPVFGNPALFTDGPWVLTGNTDPLAALGSSWMVSGYNDVPGGSPIIVKNRITDFWGSVPQGMDFRNVVTFYDPVNNVELHDTTYADFQLDLTLFADADLTDIFITKKQHNVKTGTEDRFISTLWAGQGFLLHRIDTANPYTVLAPAPGNSQSLFKNFSGGSDYLAYSVYLDQDRNIISNTPLENIQFYDYLCLLRWSSFFRPPFFGPESINAFNFQQEGYYSGGNPPYLIYLGTNNELRKYQVIRDYYICTVGGIVVPSLASIFWFFKDGVWHNQNVDTEYSLYMYRDGEWRQDGTDTAHQLMGMLDGTWQT